MVTYEDALWAREFYVLGEYYADKNRGLKLVKRTGKTKLWKTRPLHFRIPVKYGLKDSFYITHENAHQFTPVGKENQDAK